MSLLLMTARVVTRCENPVCGKKFEQPVEALRSGVKNLCCSDACIIEAFPDWVCEACGDPRDPRLLAPYQTMLGGLDLPVCLGCHFISHRSCWRKRHFPSRDMATAWAKVYQVTGLKKTLTPYECPLCERWHNTSRSMFQVADADFLRRIRGIATVYADIGFLIDDVRGWTYHPDGSRELEADFELHGGVLAAQRVLAAARMARCEQ